MKGRYSVKTSREGIIIQDHKYLDSFGLFLAASFLAGLVLVVLASVISPLALPDAILVIAGWMLLANTSFFLLYRDTFHVHLGSETIIWQKPVVGAVRTLKFSDITGIVLKITVVKKASSDSKVQEGTALYSLFLADSQNNSYLVTESLEEQLVKSLADSMKNILRIPVEEKTVMVDASK